MRYRFQLVPTEQTYRCLLKVILDFHSLEKRSLTSNCQAFCRAPRRMEKTLHTDIMQSNPSPKLVFHLLKVHVAMKRLPPATEVQSWLKRQCFLQEKKQESANHGMEMPETPEAFNGSRNRKYLQLIITYLVRACARTGSYKLAQKFVKLMQDLNLNPSLGTYNGLLDAYCYTPTRRVPRAYGMLKLMKESGVQPDCSTYATVLKICVFDERLDQVVIILNRMKREGLVLNEMIFRSIWDAIRSKIAGLRAEIPAVRPQREEDNNFVVPNNPRKKIFELVSIALHIFEKMKKHAIAPTFASYRDLGKILLGAAAPSNLLIKLWREMRDSPRKKELLSHGFCIQLLKKMKPRTRNSTSVGSAQATIAKTISEILRDLQETDTTYCTHTSRMRMYLFLEDYIPSLSDLGYHAQAFEAAEVMLKKGSPLSSCMQFIFFWKTDSLPSHVSRYD